MKIIYEEIEDCDECLHNNDGFCCKLKRPIKKLNVKEDCPLPTLSDVEKFTHYITEDKSIYCCGNCVSWKRWGYNPHLKADLGICGHHLSNFLASKCTQKACEFFKEV